METALQTAGTYVEETFYRREQGGHLVLKEDLDENMKKRADHARKMIEDARENVREAFGDDSEAAGENENGG